MPRDESFEVSVDAQGQLRWGRQAAGLLIERIDNGRILLLLRSAEVLDPGLWGIPGGRVEPGETDLEAALSEAEEELSGFPALQVVGQEEIRSGEFTYTTFFARMPGELAEAWTPKLNWENDEWRWFSKKRLPKNIHPGVAAVVRR